MCSNLTEVPAHLFDSNVNATNFSNCFYYCNSLTTLPSGLFAKNRKATDFSSCFATCNRLVLIPDLFTDESTDEAHRFADVATVNFTNCFSRSGYVSGSPAGTAPELWNATFTGTPVTTGCFGGKGNSSASLTNYERIPAEWK